MPPLISKWLNFSLINDSHETGKKKKKDLHDAYVCVCVRSLQVKDILKPEVMEEIVMLTQQKLIEQEG